MELQPKHIRAPELYGNDWLNGDPVLIRDHEGQVLLLDFWDYTSISCLRSLDYLRDWQRKYRDFGLTIVGVHTPEFRFARDGDLVRRAVRDARITYPVVLDNDQIVWSAYAVHAWPTRCLIDRDGYLRFVQHGEGGYLEFERALQQLLSESGYRGDLPELTEPVREEDLPGAVCYRPTGGLHLGYLRSTIGNAEGIAAESTINYADPGLYLPERVYLTGKWNNQRECVRLAGDPAEAGSVTVLYDAAEVNVVLRPGPDQIGTVHIEQDGVPLPAGAAGKDIRGRKSSAVTVDMPRMYRIVKNKEFGNHLLRLTTNDTGLEVYAFSFTTSLIPVFSTSN